jgi:hypothetical protein
MDFLPYLQPFITVTSSVAILLVLRQQIKSQQEQITSMKSSMDAMKAYMDIFKIDELEKYVKVKEISAITKGQNAAEQIIKDTINSGEWTKKIFEPFEEKLEKILEKDFLIKGQELFNNTIDNLSCLPKEEMEGIVKESYPLNSTAILEEFAEIEKNDPVFLRIRRESYLKSLPENRMENEEQSQIQK